MSSLSVMSLITKLTAIIAGIFTQPTVYPTSVMPQDTIVDFIVGELNTINVYTKHFGTKCHEFLIKFKPDFNSLIGRNLFRIIKLEIYFK
jgi:hypothetical protein